MTDLSSRERVLTSFRHEEPDRVPLDYMAVPEISALLIKELGLTDRDALLKRLGVDFRHLDKWGTMQPRYVGPQLPRRDDGSYQDIWGCWFKSVEYMPGCYYEEFVDFPLADARTIHDVQKHRWPDPDWYDLSPVTEYCRQDNENCLVAGMGATLDSVGFFRGIEQAMFDLYDNPGIVEAIVEKQFEFKYEYNTRFIEAAEGRLDILLIAEDMGGQNGLIVSREMLKQYVFPRFRKFADLAHKHGCLLMLHSDGAIREIIGDLIDLGIDILDPIQTGCPGMDPASLKKDFGDKLSFHGVLDSQELLPRSSSEDVLAEARRLVQVMGVNGGLALNANCGFQIDVPIANILAIYDGLNAT